MCKNRVQSTFIKKSQINLSSYSNQCHVSLSQRVFENGIDAIISYNEYLVTLIKGDQCGFLDLRCNTISRVGKISKQFQNIKGTVFEGGIDAAFNSHVENEVYILRHYEATVYKW